MDLQKHAASLQYLGIGLMSAGALSILTDHIVGGFALIFYGLGGLAVEIITGKKLADTEA